MALRDNIVDAGDVLIVGAGLAGLYTALKLAPRAVTLLAAAPIGVGAASAWAQGGVAAAIEEGDTPEQHAADTIAAGAGIVDEKIAHLMAREAPARIADLLALGVPFDRDLEGKLALGREAAHGHRRIVKVKGDRAGQAIMEALIAAVHHNTALQLMEGFAAYELAVEDGRVAGVFARPTHVPAAAPLLIKARSVVLAAGGSGYLFRVTTNPPQARGDGFAMAARAGAVIADPEFVQFHPTAIAHMGAVTRTGQADDPAPLVTEALRGEGAVLIDQQGRRFMTAVHADADLAPRDIVARAIAREIAAGRTVYLDARATVGARFPEMFPTVYALCRAIGIDPVTQPIPVAPAAHYHMGGIAVDENGRSTLPGLWACGEVASTGAHGANRLASNSLLEAVVFGARVAADIDATLPDQTRAIGIAAIEPPKIHGPSAVSAPIVTQLRELMTRHVGVERDAAGLAYALGEISRFERAAAPGTDFLNMTTAAKLIAAAAFAREESRGGHFRSDFPEARETWRHRTFLTLPEAEKIAAAAHSPGTIVQGGTGR